MKRLLALLVFALALTSFGVVGAQETQPSGEASADKDAKQDEEKKKEKKETKSAKGVRDIEVIATEFKFEPATITVKKGEQIRIILKNEGSIAHNLTVSDSDKTETIQPGDSASFEFTASQNQAFAFECKVAGHAMVGMKGEIKVEE